ncbi:MAG: hypothetical protein ACFFD5_16960, partial [Candidatus Thorarchaeota archaeon]
ILVSITTLEFIAGLIITHRELMSILYPIIIIPSLITIVWLFNFAWRNKRLSQVNTYILMIGFSLYLISSIIRPIIHIIIGLVPLFVILAEALDSIIFLIIFIGFCKKSKYSSNG